MMDTLVPNGNLSPLWQQVLFGQIASACASVVSHPFERVKLLTVQQEALLQQRVNPAKVMFQLIREGTVMQGVGLHIVRGASIGLLMTTYGQLKNYFYRLQFAPKE